MRYLDVTEQVSKELNIPIEVVNLAYRSFWAFIKDTIKALPLKGDLSEEEFNKLRTNFNIPSIGKLYVTSDKYERMKKRFEYIKKIQNVKYKENQTIK